MDDNGRAAAAAAVSYRLYTESLTTTGDRRTVANTASNTTNTNTTTLIPLPMGAELHVSFSGDAHPEGAVPSEGVVSVLPDEDDDDDDDGIEEEEEEEVQEEDDDEEEPEGQQMVEAENEVEDRRLLDRTGSILFGPAQEVVAGGPANGSPAVHDGVAEDGGAGMLLYFH